MGRPSRFSPEVRERAVRMVEEHRATHASEWRCTVGRLMRAMGLEGAVRGRAWITTTHAGNGSRPADLVDRQFVATRPNQLWVSDFTCVATWGGFTYVAFVLDVFARRIVGWRVSVSMCTDFVIDALEQAIYARRGKSDAVDAEMAARAVISGRRLSTPKNKNGRVEALRVLRLTRAGAVRSRTKALQLLRSHAVSAPDEVRDEVRSLTRRQLLRTVAAWRPNDDDCDHPATATRIAMRSLARRILERNNDVADLDDLIEPLITDLGARLIERPCIGIETAGQLLVTAGDNPGRIRSEAAWAMLCGVAPLPASSGKTDRHRLTRGGDRHANRALHMITISRLRTDERTQAFAQRKVASGKSKLEAIRCIKRYIAREVYPPCEGQHRRCWRLDERPLTFMRASAARSIFRCGTRIVSRPPALRHRSGAKAMRSITPSPSR